MPMVAVNGAELCHEIRGEGPPVLLIMGATGDCGHFDAVARMLADEFTVVTYDRRGNGRSPPPAGWTTTSAEEQADDAAELLTALDLSPAAVFGTSSGGVFALCLLLRHPEAARGGVLHEPALFSLFDDPAQARDDLTVLIRDGMAAGGPPLALERFVRFVAGDANWERFEPSLRQRVLASADTYFGVESGAFDGFLPNDTELSAIRAPVQVVVSDQSLPEFAQAARRLAAQLGVKTLHTPGTHFPYHDRPDELVRTIRPSLRSISGLPA
jgi:pimeloyl-ACP methyl ester carboxylesterase